MSDRARDVRWLGIGLAMLTAAACTQAPTGALQEVSATTAARAAAVPDRPHRKPGLDRSVADSPGKPQAPVELGYELLGTPAVGQPLRIRIEAHAPARARTLDVQLKGNAGLQLLPDPAQVRSEHAGAGRRFGRTLEVVPLAQGTIHLQALVQATIDGRVQSRVVIIPVQVGPLGAAARHAGNVTIDASGQRVVSLPGVAH